MFPSLPPLPDENDLAEILDLFEEHVYAGAITPDGRYIGHRSGPKLARFLGGPVPVGGGTASGSRASTRTTRPTTSASTSASTSARTPRSPTA